MTPYRQLLTLAACLLGAISQAQQAVFWTPDLKAYFLKGESFIKLDLKTEKQEGPAGKIADEFKGVTFTNISSVLVLNERFMFLFKGDQFQTHYFAQGDKPARTSTPRKIAEDLPGLWADGVDASFLATDDKAILFRGDEFLIMETGMNKVESGFPAKIKDHWPGLWTENIGSAVLWKDSKVIFFKGKEMIIWDLKERKKEDGTVLIEDFWKEIWPDGYNAKPKGTEPVHQPEVRRPPAAMRKPTPQPKPWEITDVGLPQVQGVKLKTAPVARTKNEDLFAAQTMEEFVDALPEWGKVYPKVFNPGQGAGTESTLGTVEEEGKRFKKKQRPYSITTTPDEIVTFQPVNGFWLGSLIQEKGLIEGTGSFTEIPVEAVKRPRIKITTDLLIPNNSRTIENPSSSEVQSALGDLISTAVRSGSRSGSSISYKSTANYSMEQTALALGFDANYLGASLKSSLETNSSATRSSFSAVYIEKAFTAKVDLEGRIGASAFFNDKFTVDDARKLVNRGDMDVDNIPTYLASVTYGRMLVFTITANASENEIKSALEASYEAAKSGVSMDIKASSLLRNSSTTITVASVGGPTEATTELIKSGKIADFFSKTATLDTMRPISYTVNSVREGRMAAMAKTTEYTATTYEQEKTILKYKLVGYWDVFDSDDGIGDSTVECFGHVKVDGATVWSIPIAAATANQRSKGGTIEVKAMTGGDLIVTVDLLSKAPNTGVIELSGLLMDWDKTSGDDGLGVFNWKINLAAEAASGRTLRLRDGYSQADFVLKIVLVD